MVNKMATLNRYSCMRYFNIFETYGTTFLSHQITTQVPIHFILLKAMSTLLTMEPKISNPTLIANITMKYILFFSNSALITLFTMECHIFVCYYTSFAFFAMKI